MSRRSRKWGARLPFGRARRARLGTLPVRLQVEPLEGRLAPTANAAGAAITPTLVLPQVQSVADLGPVGSPVSVTSRDGGASGLVGGYELWTFNDTIFNQPNASGAGGLTSTAALAYPGSPTHTLEPLDSKGDSLPFLAQTPAEQASQVRIALWPTSVVPVGSQGAWVFYQQLYVLGGLDFQSIGTGLAWVPAGSTTAVRSPGLLFQAPEPQFSNATVVVGDTLYVYGAIVSNGAPSTSMAVAQVPLSQIGNRSAYTFWNGSAWVSDVSQAAPVLTDIPGGLSVSYNAYLGEFVAIHSSIGTNQVLMQVAANPAGPWSAPVSLYTAPAPGPGAPIWDYAAIEHPELDGGGGSQLAITYFHPTGPLSGNLEFLQVNLAKPAPSGGGSGSTPGGSGSTPSGTVVTSFGSFLASGAQTSTPAPVTPPSGNGGQTGNPPPPTPTPTPPPSPTPTPPPTPAFTLGFSLASSAGTAAPQGSAGGNAVLVAQAGAGSSTTAAAANPVTTAATTAAAPPSPIPTWNDPATLDAVFAGGTPTPPASGGYTGGGSAGGSGDTALADLGSRAPSADPGAAPPPSPAPAERPTIILASEISGDEPPPADNKTDK